jgi:hypothetical protein
LELSSCLLLRYLLCTQMPLQTSAQRGAK